MQVYELAFHINNKRETVRIGTERALHLPFQRDHHRSSAQQLSVDTLHCFMLCGRCGASPTLAKGRQRDGALWELQLGS